MGEKVGEAWEVWKEVEGKGGVGEEVEGCG